MWCFVLSIIVVSSWIWSWNDDGRVLFLTASAVSYFLPLKLSERAERGHYMNAGVPELLSYFICFVWITCIWIKLHYLSFSISFSHSFPPSLPLLLHAKAPSLAFFLSLPTFTHSQVCVRGYTHMLLAGFKINVVMFRVVIVQKHVGIQVPLLLLCWKYRVTGNQW